MRDRTSCHPFQGLRSRRTGQPGDPAAQAPSTRQQTWTVEQIRGLGMTTDLETAASIIGIGRTPAYTLARDNQFPIRLLRLGRRVLVPTADLLTYLGEQSSDTPNNEPHGLGPPPTSQHR